MNTKLVEYERARIFRITGLILRIIFGSVFVFSGFVKAVDPLGFNYKMQDYLHAMGFIQFDSLTLICAISMIALEFTIGLSLITSIKLHFFSWCAMLFMLFMTPLTLWLAITDPITDCGCFGDALVISNWATFWKNIVLLMLISVILYCEKYHRPYLSPLPSWLITFSFFVFSVCISLYCLAHLPLLDFRPYKIGKNISEQMIIPENAPKDEYKTTFTYRNKQSKEEKIFNSLNEAPWNDTINWEYVAQKSKRIKKGYEPPIHDFIIDSYENGDITEEVLADTSLTFLFVMYDLTKTKTEHLKDLNFLYKGLYSRNLRCIALTASLFDEIEDFRKKYDIEYEFYTCDPIALKTVVRANPGVIVLKKGTVVDKWNAADTKKAFRKFEKKHLLKK